MNWQALLVAASLVSPSAAQAPAGGDAPGPASGAPVPQVTLLQPGESPRQLLRLVPRIGKFQAFDVTMRMESRQTVDGQEITARVLPALRFSFRTTIREISPGGEIIYDAECTGIDAVDAPGADPALVEQAREGFQLLVGLRGKGRVTDRGISRGASLRIPADLDPALAAYVSTLERIVDQSVPLPQEPVGPRGSWQARTSLEDQGTPVTQTSVYTLAGFDGTTLQIDLKISQEAVLPQPAAGDPVRLTSYTSHGTGRIRLRLDETFPSKADSDVVNESTWVIDQGGQRQQMLQRTRNIAELTASAARP